MSFLKPTALTSAVIVALTSPMAFAETEQTVATPAATLDPIVVTASRTAEKLSSVPARVEVINRQTLEQNPALNLSDVLQRDASISVKQSGGIGQVPEISLRGTSAKHTLFLKDGARLNTQNDVSPIFTGFLDTSDVERVEILKGPASVQYGSDAIGGVIQMVSQAPQKTTAFATGLYGENDTYKAIVGGDVVLNNGLYAQVRGQRLETDGTRIFASQAEGNKASYDQKGYSAKIGYDNKRAHRHVDASLSISENEGTNLFNRLNTNPAYTLNNAPRYFENRVINGQLTFGPHERARFSARFSRVEDKQNVPSYGSVYNTESNEADVNGRIYFAPKQNVLFGVTSNKSEYETSTLANNAASVDVNTVGYYAQHQYKSDRLDTQVGVRVEDHERFGTHTVGQAAARLHFSPATSVYANVGSAFRAPTLNELYSQWGGNVNLQPEESLAYELGFDHKIGNNFTANLSAYHNEIKNLIAYGSAYSYENLQKATFTGGEAGLKWAKDDYFASLQYAYVETENKATGLEVAYRPKQTVTFTTGIENEQAGVSLSAIARSAANAENNSNPVRVPGYTTFDINGYVNVLPYVKLFANIQNVGNVQYKEVYNTYPTTDWYINGGRQTNVGVTFRY
ncbi:MAG: TonB-dependent receptor [Acinetobacter sp.]|nr:TonB-dependent receptor [Acinetobacter sp.]